MRQTKTLLVITTGVLSFMSSCKDWGSSVNKTEISGTYIYKQYDTTGIETNSGTLTLKRVDSQLIGQFSIIGSFLIDSVEGRIIEPDTIELSSNPHRAVGNYVLWRGVRNDGSIQGDFYGVTYDPPIPLKGGTFLATKVDN